MAESDDRRVRWLGTRPVGELVKDLLPLDAFSLDDEGWRMFQQAVASTQSGAAMPSAGYFRIRGKHDPLRDVNKDLLKWARDGAAGGPVCAWLEIELAAVMRGEVDEIAADYRGAAMVGLRVAGLVPGAVGRAQGRAVLLALIALRSAGTRPFLDCITTAGGAAAFAAGAHAWSSGGSHHRSVPLELGRIGTPRTPALGFEDTLNYRHIAIEPALDSFRRKEVDKCPTVGCGALREKMGKGKRSKVLRRHFVHASETIASLVTQQPSLEVAADLIASPEPSSQSWGEALRDVGEDSADVSIQSGK